MTANQELIEQLAASELLGAQQAPGVPEDESPKTPIASGIDEEFGEHDTFHVVSDRTTIVEGARTNLDFLAQLILTDIYEYGYPALFHAIWQLITKDALELKGKPKYALGIPRGFSKTVILKLYVTWLVLFSDRRFILVVCNTAALAENFLSDVTDMLNNINIKTIFGAWNAECEKDTLAFKKFSFRGRDIVLAALGAGSSLRGLNLKFVRPDVVIMDDMQNRDEAENAEVAKDLLVWMLGTLMKACHPHRCIFIFVGNMYPFEGSILRKLKASSEWTSFVTGAILADGNSLWPEHRSLNDLLSELQSDTDMGHPEIFFSEVMNDEEAGTVSGIDVSKITTAPEYLDTLVAQGGCVIIDPSLGKKKSDDVGIGAFLIFDSIPVLWDLAVGKFSPLECIHKATEFAAKYSMQLIICEGGAYQATLIFWFNHVYQQMGVEGFKVGEITTGGMQKNARIIEMFKLLLSGNILLHKRVRSAVIYQITQWNRLKANNKDEILDLLAYIHKVKELHAEYLPLLISDIEVVTMPAASHTNDLQLPF